MTPPDEHLIDVLKAAQRGAARLMAGSPRPPSTLRVRAGDVSIEMEWAPPTSASASASTAVGTADSSPQSPPLARSEDALATGGGESSASPFALYAPGVGVFYRAPEPGAEPFVREGDVVVPGRQVAILEAMKLMIPIEADRAGRVIEVLPEDGASVEYGERLFTLEPVGATGERTCSTPY
jgi:acetyl-CoA carboxylase biotin carboxyl carrier protein